MKYNIEIFIDKFPTNCKRHTIFVYLLNNGLLEKFKENDYQLLKNAAQKNIENANLFKIKDEFDFNKEKNLIDSSNNYYDYILFSKEANSLNFELEDNIYIEILEKILDLEEGIK